MIKMAAERDIPVISVCLITYNHAPFITQAIESILMQKHGFSWELIIADDGSSDGTTEIILEFKNKYPDLIRPIIREKNVGAFQNWKEMLNAAKGKYIAYLEGDDYWTDCNKLKEQATILESNPQYIGCFHNCEERFDNDGTKASFLYCSFPGSTDISFSDLVYKNLIPSCSMFYRNIEANRLPDWFGELKMGDWPLHLLNATIGKYRFIPKVMGVHRHHTGSTWMQLNTQDTNQYVLDAYETFIRVFANQVIYQRQLITAKQLFLHPPKPSMKRRAANFIKKFIDR
jgi:glycosyltransferase involved in cell wall biosynthesis